MMKNAISVDVEDWFQVSAFEDVVDRRRWDSLPHRVEANTIRLLELFDEYDTKCTFFTLGWVAERYPHLVRKMVDAGHEVASHGMTHTRVTEQQPDEFLADVIESKKMLEDLSGQAVRGYRAASYSIGESNTWALAKLAEAGYEYSSSIYPIKHDLYGMPNAPRFNFYPENAPGLLEIPITTVQVGNRKFPCGGGGWFRLLPYELTRKAIQRVNDSDQQSAVFYMHPWEIDPSQPRPEGARLKSRFRHYLNLSRTEQRLRKLLSDFEWDRMDSVFLDERKDSNKAAA